MRQRRARLGGNRCFGVAVRSGAPLDLSLAAHVSVGRDPGLCGVAKSFPRLQQDCPRAEPWFDGYAPAFQWFAEAQALPWPLTAGALAGTVVGLALIRAPPTAPEIATTSQGCGSQDARSPSAVNIP